LSEARAMQAAGRVGEGAAAGIETQERFLRDMALRLPLDRVVEVHVFPAIRQGGVETGLAVIAARREAEAEVEEAPGEGLVAAPPPRLHDAPPDDAGHHPSDAERSTSPPDAAAEEGHDAPAVVGEADAARPDTESSPEPGDAPHAALPERHTILSAHYRLTLKGPDRGRWEVDVVEEADAPLVTVDAVVRGVQRRGGEGAEPERYSAEQFRALLPPDGAAGDPVTRR
jgi:hypothetical protein